MISYEPFWITLQESDETTYSLVHNHKMSSSTIHRLRYNKALSTTTLNDICRILQCKIEDIIRYTNSDKDQKL